MMTTVSELQAVVQNGFKDGIFAQKVHTAVLAIGLCGLAVAELVQTAVISNWHDVEMRTIERGQQIHQAVNVERSRNKEDAIESIAKARIQEQKESTP